MNRQDTILPCIKEHWARYTTAPTITYIHRHTGLAKSHIHAYYRILTAKGFIKLCGSPGSHPKPVPIEIYRLIKETLPNEPKN